jgi:hypothetical protein
MAGLVPAISIVLLSADRRPRPRSFGPQFTPRRKTNRTRPATRPNTGARSTETALGAVPQKYLVLHVSRGACPAACCRKKLPLLAFI